MALIEKPRRALFISRIYEVPVLLNKLFPAIVDWVSETWVQRKRKKELPSVEEVSPVHYGGSLSLWQLAGGLIMFVLIARLKRKKL